jgi:hypothetical protein
MDFVKPKGNGEMINWNDVRVEAELAQERYQQVIRARRIAQIERCENGGDGWSNALQTWRPRLAAWWNGVPSRGSASRACC